MKPHKQNSFFDFQIAERRLVGFDAEKPGNTETKTEGPDSKSPEMKALEDKALKAVDRLGLLMNAMKDGETVKPKYKENFKKLQTLQKKIQSHLENTEAKKEVLSGKVITKTLNNLNKLVGEKGQLHNLNRRILEGSNQDGGLVAKAIEGIEYGTGNSLINIYSLMKNGGIRKLTKGKYKGSKITKIGNKLIVKHPKRGKFTFIFKVEGGKWKASDKNGQQLDAESVNRMFLADNVGGETMKTVIDSRNIATNYYENNPEANTEEAKGGISVLNMKYINQSSNRITFKNITNKVTINNVLDSSKQQLVLIKKGIPQVITSTKKGWVNLSTKGKDKRPRIDNGNQIVEVTDNKQHLKGTKYYVEKDKDGKLIIKENTKNIQRNVTERKIDTSNVTKETPINKNRVKSTVAKRQKKSPEYKRSKEESALLNENKEKPVDKELNETVSDNAKKVWEMLSQGYLTYVKPMIKAIQKLKTPEPSFKEAAKPVRKLIQRTKTLYQKTNEDTPAKDTIANLKKVMNTVPKEVRDMEPLALLEEGISSKYLEEGNTEEPTTPTNSQENQENEIVTLEGKIKSIKDGLSKLKKPQDTIIFTTKGGEVSISKVGNKYKVGIINEKGSGEITNLSNKEIEALATQMKNDKVTYISKENTTIKNTPTVEASNTENLKQKPSQQAKEVMKLVNQDPVDKKALEKALREIAKNPKFTATSEAPMRLGNSGYYLSKTNNGNVRVELKDGNNYKLAFLAKNGETGLYSYNPLKSIGTGLI